LGRRKRYTCPSDSATFTGRLNTPTVAADEQRHNVKPVRSAVRFGSAPFAALIFDLDPHVGAEQLAADGERPYPGQTVKDSVAGELGNDQRHIIGYRAVSEIVPNSAPGQRHLLWRAREGP
jgi:hypothetical protein